MHHHSSAFKASWNKLSVVALASSPLMAQALEFEMFLIGVFHSFGQCDLNPPIPTTPRYQTWPAVAIQVADGLNLNTNPDVRVPLYPCTPVLGAAIRKVGLQKRTNETKGKVQ
jgi:hypothetical protein